MRKHLRLRAVFAIPLFLISGCDVTDHFLQPRVPRPGINRPIVAVGTGSFSFAVDADRYNFGVSRVLDFPAASYALDLALSGHRSGHAIIELRDMSGTVVRVDSVYGDTVLTDGHLMVVAPRYVTLVLDDFSGKLSFLLETADNLQEFPFFHFPLRPGASWTYQRVSTSSGAIDTVQLTAGRRYRHPDGPDAVSLIVTRSSSPILGEADTLDAFWGNDMLTISDTHNALAWPELILRFPLRRGDAWTGRFAYNGYTYVRTSNAVTKVGSVHVPAGTYDPAYIIDEQLSPGLTYGDESQWWITPGIGIVRMRLHNEYVYWSGIEEWVLLSYRPG